MKHMGVFLNSMVVTDLGLILTKVLQPAPFPEGVSFPFLSFPAVVDLQILHYVSIWNYLQTNGRQQKSWSVGLSLLD